MTNDRIASLLRLIGWVAVLIGIVCIIAGLKAGAMAVGMGVASVISGIMLFGFAGIITLLATIVGELRTRLPDPEQQRRAAWANRTAGTDTPDPAPEKRQRADLPKPTHWFIHCGRRVEIAEDGSAMVDGMTFADDDAAVAFLNQKYPDRRSH